MLTEKQLVEKLIAANGRTRHLYIPASANIAVHDKTHTRFAIARFAYFEFKTKKDLLGAAKRLARAAKRFGILEALE